MRDTALHHLKVLSVNFRCLDVLSGLLKMTKEDMEMVAMEIVAYAGEARTQFLKAMDAMADKDWEAAEKLISEGYETVLSAHDSQTDMIAREAGGEDMELCFLMVHAQDHLMNAMLLGDMCKRFMKMMK